MEDPKKKTPEEEKDEQEKKPEPTPDSEGQKEPEKPAPDESQADENGEGAKPPEPDKPPEEKSEEPKVPDPKDEEILRLKTQIAAMNLGVKPECVEDAVAIAESYVKSGKAKDVQAALSEVVKKYPDMKGDGKNGKPSGFKVGADAPKDGSKANEEKLNNAFGIRKKK